MIAIKVSLDKSIKKLLSSSFQKHKQVMKRDRSCDFHMNLKELDEILKYINWLSYDNTKQIRSYLSLDISLSYVSIIALGALSLAVNQKDIKNPISIDWFIDKLDANEILQNLIIQITNHSLAIVNLVEDGFDNSARLLIRPLLELISLTLIVISSKEHMDAYRNGNNEDDASDIWYKFFRFEHTNRKLAQIESALGLPKELVDDFKDIRTESYKFYSSISHNAYYSCVLGSYAVPFDNVSEFKLSLFGKYSYASTGTINKLNELLYYFNLVIIAIINKLHQFKAPSNNEVWRMAFALRKAAIDAHIYVKENSENEAGGNS